MVSEGSGRGTRVVVAMSGGVDSSVVAAMLADEGYDVVGISMRLYEIEDPQRAKGCCSPDDLYDARAVCARLDVPFYVSNDEDLFRQRVIDYFVEEYLRGRTPNPCVMCNNHLKFDALLAKAASLRASFLATGHYARIEHVPDEDRWGLFRGVDSSKDQSYFLFGMNRDLLERVRFPLGGLDKARTRALAERFGLPTAGKPESQEICFVAGSYADVVERHAGEQRVKPGAMIHEDGRVLGSHDGIHNFTIGQRRGLGLSYHEPLYVKEIRPSTGDVIVGPRSALFVKGLSASRANWLRWSSPPAEFEGEVKFRYGADPLPARIITRDDGGFDAEFAVEARAITPGQAAVIYDGDEVVGGGWIERALG